MARKYSSIAPVLLLLIPFCSRFWQVDHHSHSLPVTVTVTSACLQLSVVYI